jgi:prepilin peptidase CpaA
LIIGVLFFFVAICFITDLSERKIYNVVIMAGLISALILNIIDMGFRVGTAFTLFGFFTGILLLLIPFMLGGLGAGDTKMLGMVGAFLGSALAVQVFLASAVAGGMYALVIMVREGGTLKRLKNIYRALLCFLLVRKTVHLEVLQDESAARVVIPYGAAITAGVIIIYIMGSMNHALSVMITAGF